MISLDIYLISLQTTANNKVYESSFFVDVVCLVMTLE